MNRSILGRASELVAGLSDRDRRALKLGALVLLPVLLWVLVARPYLGVLGQMEERLAAERDLLVREQAVLRQAPLLPEQLERANEAMDRWDGRFIRSPNLALAQAEAASVVEAVAQSSRVLLQEVSEMEPPPGSPVPQSLHPIRMSVRGEGDFQGVLEFVDALEQDPILFRIVGMSLERPAATVTPGQANDPNSLVAIEFVVIVEAYAPVENGSV